MQNILNLKQYWAILVIFTLLFSIAGFGISIFQLQKYESTVQLLVIQKYGDQFDAFTAKRSAETVAETLSTIVYTSTFMNQALLTPIDDLKDNFPKDLKERKKAWKKEINAKLLEAGNFQITVYDPNHDQAEKLAYAIAYTLVTKGNQYHGGGQQVEIKMVERPITSNNTVYPNIYLNTFLGFIVGFLTAIGLIFLMPAKPAKKIKLEKNKQAEKAIPKSTVPDNLPIVKKEPTNNKHAKGYTGEEYSENKVDEWVKTGRFNR